MNTNQSKSSKDSPAQKARFSEGQKLAGCYALKRRIAGAVEPEIWLAYDEVLGKDVSLHFVPQVILGDAATMSALRLEVKRTRQLIHPNILRVYDLVEDADWAAVSMDAFEGESLSARLGETKGAGLDPDKIAPWIRQLCQTLDDAHKINVVHRNVSPENIFLGGEGKLFVTGFGISRCIADAVSRISEKEDARLAAMSPQQLDQAAPARLDDVYSIGALLFETLTGRLPFIGADLPGQIRNAAPPSVSALRRQGATPVPAGWESAIAGCLEKKTDARLQTAAEIAKRLTSADPEIAATAAKTAAKKQVARDSVAPAAAAKVGSGSGKNETKSTGKGASFTAPAKSSAPATSHKRKLTPSFDSEPSPALSRFPAMGFAVALGLIAIGALGFYLNGKGGGSPRTEPTGGLTPAEAPEGLELQSVTNKAEPVIKSAEIPPVTATVAPAPPAPVPPPAVPANPVLKPEPPKPPVLMAAAAPVATPSPAPPVPAPQPATAAPQPASDEDRDVAEKAAALEKAKQAAQAAEKAREEMAKQQQQAAAAVAEAQKALDQKAKAIDPIKKAADEVLAQRKKLEAEQKAADAAAEQARQLAAEKVRQAEVAKKAITELDGKNKDKLAAQEKADAEILALQKTLEGKQQSAAAAVKAAADALSASQQQQMATRQREQEVEQARLVAAEARRLREEAEAERRKLGQELAEMQKMMERKKLEIEDRLKKLETPAAKPAASAPAPEPTKLPEAKPVEKPLPPEPPIKPTSAVPPPATPAPLPATPAPVAALPKPATPAPATPAPVAVPKPATPAPAPAPEAAMQLALKTDPKVAIPEIPVPKPAPSAAGAENSLGMKFVPVGGVEFCIWQTRLKDFEAFAKAVNLKSSAWKGPGFKQGPDHPVVNVTWVEAVAFCKWLTDLEHKDGTLPAGQFYRLPTDLEWSQAVGLPEESGKTAEARDMGVSDVYPWGTQWPPPPNSGNYTGEETGSDVAIKGYDDGYAWTSPVGSFPPNKAGIYDMGGNVWQWCMDAWNNESKAKVLRGASWYNGALKLSLLSSCRVHAAPESSTDNYGFRIVRTLDAGKPGKK